MNVLLFLIQIACFWITASGLTCLKCQASSIQYCLNSKVNCGSSTEECFLDKTILQDLSVVFTAGCREKHICTVLEGLNGKRSIEGAVDRNERSTIDCTHCCNSQPNHNTGIPCNAYLCSQKPVTVTGSYSCASCDKTTDYHTCATSSQCAPNEMCSTKALIDGGQIVYKLGCERKLICDHILKDYKASHHGRSIANGLIKRSPIEICAACCDTSDCNKHDCKTILSTLQKCNDHSICG